eukprot:7667828-Pyramimonas_sp.AAC.1
MARNFDANRRMRMGIFSRRTNRMQDTWVYSHDGPIPKRMPHSASPDGYHSGSDAAGPKIKIVRNLIVQR